MRSLGPLSLALILAAAVPGGLERPLLAEEKPATSAATKPLPLAGLSSFTKGPTIELMGASFPQALFHSAADGGLWFAAPKLGAVGRIDVATGKPTYFHLGKGARPVALAEGPDRLIYVADRALNVIHRVRPSDSEIIRIPMPSDAPHLDLAALAFDNDGRLWFSGAAGWLGSYDLASGTSEVSSHDDLMGLSAVARAGNGALVFIAAKAGRLIRIEPGRPRFDSSSLPEGFRRIRGVAAGAASEIWVAAFNENALALHTGRGKWQKITLPWPDSQPHALLARRDGSLLVADGGRRKLLRYVPQLGQFEELGELGEGGAIKSLVETDLGIAIADAGADHILIFREDPAPAN